jgi:peptidoglycan/LPS O-acetylase OafA/YrhL
LDAVADDDGATAHDARPTVQADPKATQLSAAEMHTSPQCGETIAPTLPQHRGSLYLATMSAHLSRVSAQRKATTMANVTSPPATTKAVSSIDTLRGLACLLLVGYHVVGATSASGMRVADDSFYRTVLADAPLLVRMPLFTFLSGFVYAYRPVRLDSAVTFVRGKVRRLLIPLVVAGSAFVVLQSLVPTNAAPIDLVDIWRIYIWPYAHYWYLHALFVIFALMVVLDGYRLMSTVGRWAACFAVSVPLFLFGSSLPSFFGLDQAAYLLPFFLWGLAAQRFKELLTPTRRTAIVGVAFALFVLAQLATAADWSLPHTRDSALGLLVGTTGTLALQQLQPRSRRLAQIGVYSYAIYLYHVFATAGMRWALGRVTDVQPVHFVAGLTAGIALPIVVYLIAVRHPMTRLLLLGQTTRAAGA